MFPQGDDSEELAEAERSSPLRDMAGDVVDEGGALGPADRDRLRATGMERAAGRGVDRIRRLAADGRARPAAHCKVRHGVEQHAGIGVARAREQSDGGRPGDVPGNVEKEGAALLALSL